MESVPERGVEAGFEATENWTVPFPEPEAPPVTLIHVALLVAFQLHPEPALTETLREPPAEGTVAAELSSE
jgi:hypothetical protein